MPRRRDEDEEYVAIDEEVDDGGKGRRKRGRLDYAEEDDDDDYGGGGGRRGKRNRQAALGFFDIEAAVDSDDEEEDGDEEDDGFIDVGSDIPEEADRQIHRRTLLQEADRRIHRRTLLPSEYEEEDVDKLERKLQEKFGGTPNVECDEEATDVEQQALLPSVRDPKLWLVKCALGHEKQVAVCLMQKCINQGSERIKSALALDHLTSYIYIEADKEAHVKEAIKGMRHVFTSQITLVPIKEMTGVLSVESKAVDISRDTWVRLRVGTYKGDLAKVVHIDSVRQRATVKVIPRIDLQALANNLEGREVPNKKAFAPPARFMNIDEARELNIRVERKRDRATGECFEKIGGMMFKDGFLHKTVSLKSLTTQNVQSTFDELERFRQSVKIGDGDMLGLSTLFANRKRGHFMKGDRVIVVKGDLRNLKGCVEKVEEGIVHIKTNGKGLPKTLAVDDKEICKYFEPGNHVKVVSGASEGATGTVVSVESHMVHLVSDTAKELIRVFVDNVVESSEVTSGLTRIGDYELHDLVLLNDNSFGVIISVESEAFKVLKGDPGRPVVAFVRLREIRHKIQMKFATDRLNHRLSVTDVVRVLDGPCKGKQGPIKYIYNGVLFIHDRHHLGHAGLICVKSESCMMVGGQRASREMNGNCSTSRFAQMRTTIPERAKGGGRGRDDSLIGVTVKIRQGGYKGCWGRVKGVKGSRVRIELESQANFVEVLRSQISDVDINVNRSRETWRCGMGSETPLHPHMTPMRDSGGATPYHDGMRTPLRDRAWNPYTPMSPHLCN